MNLKSENKIRQIPELTMISDRFLERDFKEWVTHKRLGKAQGIYEK